MQRERISGMTAFSVVTDAAGILVSFFLAYLIVDSLKQYLPGPYQARQLYELGYYGWWLMIDLALTLSLLYFFGFYTFGRTLSYFDILLNLAKALGSGFFLLIFVLFLLRVQDVSRLLLGTHTLVKFIILLNLRVLLKSVIGKLHEHGYDQINALVLGTGARATNLIQRLSSSPDLGYRIVGVLTENGFPGLDLGRIPVLGKMRELRDVLLRQSIDEVFFAASIEERFDIDDLVFACEEVGVRFSVLADWFRPNLARTSLRSLGELPLLTFSTTPSQVGQLMAKAVMDRFLSALLIVLISPLLLGIALAIKLGDRGPVFFHQRRSGLNGRVFKMYKFRTMVPNAESLQKELTDRNEMSGPVFKIAHDPRVTGVGRWLRRYSLDELPQLFNVLLGDMSLVGPRPPIPEEVRQYERWQRRRLSMKPGLTCFWQIGGRNQIDFSEWMELDLKYIDNWSLKLDIIILLKTIPVVLLGKGAS
ncbi:MAG: sugar transferase [Myxococcales bacterium]|nr:sugar transferase [Myxococcales bacterium]